LREDKAGFRKLRFIKDPLGACYSGKLRNRRGTQRKAKEKPYNEAAKKNATPQKKNVMLSPSKHLYCATNQC
jgi:hypothetical protein